MNSIRYRSILMLVVAGTVILSGCYVGSSSYNGSIKLDGNVTEQNDQLVIEGEIVNGGVRNVSATDLRIHLYHKNGTRIETIQIGQFRRQKSVSIRRETVPYYIILDAPMFWNTPKVEVYYYRRARPGDHYIPEVVSNRYELPVSPPDHSGDENPSESRG